MLDRCLPFWPYFVAVLDVLVAVWASSHAVLHKRESRAAIAWVGMIWLVPILGSALYVWLGINRIQRLARKLRFEHRRPGTQFESSRCTRMVLDQNFKSDGVQFPTLIRLIDEVTRWPLLHGNRIEPLVNGDRAYPAMLQAIDSATGSITLSTYIFDNDRAGRMFLEALQRAVARKVEVRVLIDDVGSRYTRPTMIRLLRRSGIRVAKFMPVVPWRFQFTNLRTHRKILVVDGRVGFTGGMNIREGNCLSWQPRHPIQDLQFRVTGPVVAQLQEIFAEDWAFCTDERLEGEPWFVEIPADGPVLARGLPDGPDEDFESFRLTLLGAIATARSSILVMTPYFLPESALITSLNVAALRGIDVDIVLPEHSNLPYVQWASTALWWQLLERGCRIWLTRRPFDHSKVLVIDDVAVFVGSTNWDPRSLRLNFEFNLECYDRELASQLADFVRKKLRDARSVTLADVDGRSLPIRLRDGIARLCSPYM